MASTQPPDAPTHMRVLAILRDRARTGAAMPTYTELRDLLAKKNTESVTRALRRLEADGLIRRAPSRGGVRAVSRAIEVTQKGWGVPLS